MEQSINLLPIPAWRLRKLYVMQYIDRTYGTYVGEDQRVCLPVWTSHEAAMSSGWMVKRDLFTPMRMVKILREEAEEIARGMHCDGLALMLSCDSIYTLPLPPDPSGTFNLEERLQNLQRYPTVWIARSMTAFMTTPDRGRNKALIAYQTKAHAETFDGADEDLQWGTHRVVHCMTWNDAIAVAKRIGVKNIAVLRADGTRDVVPLKTKKP